MELILIFYLWAPCVCVCVCVCLWTGCEERSDYLAATDAGDGAPVARFGWFPAIPAAVGPWWRNMETSTGGKFFRRAFLAFLDVPCDLEHFSDSFFPRVAISKFIKFFKWPIHFVGTTHVVHQVGILVSFS